MVTGGADLNIKVLSLTDTSTTEYLLEEAFESNTYQFQSLSLETTESLRQELREWNPDLLFISSNVRSLDAFQFCETLKKREVIDSCRIVIISSDKKKREKAFEHRADAFLSLPFSSDEATRLAPDPQAKQHHVLYVEDSEYQHENLVPDLREEGYQVSEAYDGLEGLETFRNDSSIDIVVSDIEMPEMGGYKLCEKLKDEFEIPVILASSLDTDEKIQKGLETGANDYITKPILSTELIHRIERILDSKRNSRPETILAVDDSEMMRDTVTQYLEDQGFSVVGASNGREALEEIKSGNFNLVVTDYEMPEVNGYELAHKIRENYDRHDLPVIVLSSRDSQADLVRMRSAGVQTVLSKPFDGDRLNAEVERILGNARLKQQEQVMQQYLSEETLNAVERFSGSSAADEYFADNKFSTIFFVDMVGFTELCENLSPSEVVDLLNTYFDKIVSILVDYDATIDKFIGDAVLALFGSDENGARNAVTAAREIIEATNILRNELDLDLHVRIGINSGPVIVGDLGSRHYRRDFTVVGDNVNVAQRLEEVADPDGIVISEATYSLVEDSVKISRQKSVQPKGKSEPITIFEVEDIDPVDP